MTALVSYFATGHTGSIVIESPRVNAFSQYFWQGIVDALQSDADDATQIVVLRYQRRTRGAGADVKEFCKPPQASALAARGVSVADIGR